MKTIIAIIAVLVVWGAGGTEANAAWSVSSDKNEMTGEVSYYAISSAVYATRPLSFPYRDLRMFIGIGCRKGGGTGRWWAYLGFHGSVNIAGGKWVSGERQYDIRMRWDNRINSFSFVKDDVESRFFHLKRNLLRSSFLDKVKYSSVALVEIPLFDQGEVYFRVGLQGTRRTLAQLGRTCSDSELQ